MTTPFALSDGQEVTKRLLDLWQICQGHNQYHQFYGPISRRLSSSAGKRPNKDELLTKPTSCEGSWKIYALDCEMILCKNKSAPRKPEASRLARVSIVRCSINESSWSKTDGKEEPSSPISFVYEVVFDEYAKLDPMLAVTNYLTEVSGVKPEHLQEPIAKFGIAEIHKCISELITDNTIILGHSLWSDYEALKLWHPIFVDTSFLFGVKSHPNIILSLKDAMSYVESILNYSESHMKIFQPVGEAHDPILDAKCCASVVAGILEIEKNLAKRVAPITLKEIPRRFLKRLTAFGLPKGCTQDTVRLFIESVAADNNLVKETYFVRNIKWMTRRDGAVIGSAAIEFSSEAFAKRIFDAIPPIAKNCDGPMKAGSSHPDGWPGKTKHMKKLAAIKLSESTTGNKRLRKEGAYVIEINSYFPAVLTHTDDYVINGSKLGRLVGHHGKRVLMIQQCSGTRISTIEKGVTAKLLIEADSREKVAHAKELMKRGLTKGT